MAHKSPLITEEVPNYPALTREGKPNYQAVRDKGYTWRAAYCHRCDAIAFASNRDEGHSRNPHTGGSEIACTRFANRRLLRVHAAVASVANEITNLPRGLFIGDREGGEVSTREAKSLRTKWLAAYRRHCYEIAFGTRACPDGTGRYPILTKHPQRILNEAQCRDLLDRIALLLFEYWPDADGNHATLRINQADSAGVGGTPSTYSSFIMGLHGVDNNGDN